ncbi:DUF4373 domain-containing protein [Paenibacillus odorifer]|uniref:DUF4373 domain-containing protein n=1 Tax=Paenibacillus odorifer TaxID=189426 RepID=UPI00096FCC55|nr:DUF4373 domain-containing protein [Paenibacillus odorifer]OMD08371.1 hypothetical protein BJP50_07210 [Paenibacillus odorifer]
MARPRKEGMDYFPHDVNLSSDKKIDALRIIHGNDGYTFFCIMLELIYQEPNFELDVSDAETIQILAKKVEVTTQKLHEMILTSVKHGCFDREKYEDDQVLTSNGIKKRASVVVDKRVKMREKSRSDAVPVVSPSVSSLVSAAETGVESTQSKSKSKSKVKEKKDIIPKINFAEFVSLTQEEHNKLTETHGEDKVKRMIETLDNYKGASGKKYTSDYRAILNWVVKRVEEDDSKLTLIKGGGNGGKYQTSYAGVSETSRKAASRGAENFIGSPGSESGLTTEEVRKRASNFE